MSASCGSSRLRIDEAEELAAGGGRGGTDDELAVLCFHCFQE